MDGNLNSMDCNGSIIMELEITDGINTQLAKVKEGVACDDAVIKLYQLYEEDYLNLTYTLWIDNEIYLSLEFETKMNAEDQAKLAKAGYTIIQRQDEPEPHIKYKNKENPDSWKRLPEKFTSKDTRDRYANDLLEQKLVIEY